MVVPSALPAAVFLLSKPSTWALHFILQLNVISFEVFSGTIISLREMMNHGLNGALERDSCNALPDTRWHLLAAVAAAAAAVVAAAVAAAAAAVAAAAVAAALSAGFGAREPLGLLRLLRQLLPLPRPPASALHSFRFQLKLFCP